MVFTRLSVILLLITPFAAGAQTAPDPQAQQQSPDDTERLQKLVQNPVANIVNVPLQYNRNFPIGPFSRTQEVLNFQPVIPLPLGENWNLITRVIQPLIAQPYLNREEGSKNGVGDLSPTFFLTPSKPGKLIWGAGPAFSLPTATNTVLGTGKWAAGPSVVALVQPGHWTLGALANNLWSVAGNKDRADVTSFLLQYFVNYNFVKGWYFNSSPIITSNWKAGPNERWTVPFGPGLGKVFKFREQSFNAQASTYYTLIHPDSLPYHKWEVQLQLAWIFPLER